MATQINIKDKLATALVDFQKLGHKYPGAWEVKERAGDGSRLFLVWSISASEWAEMAERDALYGDEPWTSWGGDIICSGLPEPEESDVESVMIGGEEEVQQWAAWPASTEEDGSIAWQAPEVYREIAPFYKRYDGLDRPQPVLLCLSGDGIVSVETDGEPGDAVPARVWLGRDFRWQLPSEISSSGVESVRGDLWPMLERVYLGHSTEWDGSNHVGRLSADGQEAELEIQGYLYNGLADCRCDKVQSALDWLGELGAHDLVSDDQTLEQALESIQDQAEADGVYIHDLDLESLAALLGERPDEELGPRHRAILREYFR